MSKHGLPVGWVWVKFGDVAKQIKDTVDPETSDLERYVAGGHMDTDDLKIRRWGLVGDGYLGPAFHCKFQKGQILYGSRRTYLRKVAVADFDGICANTTFVIEARPSKIHPPLLPFIMQSEPFVAHSINNSRGSTNPYINWKDIARYEFALPTLDEQRRIAEVLTAVEDVLHNWKFILDDLDTLRNVLSFDLFKHHGSGIPELKCSDLCHEITVGIVVKPASYYVDGSGVPALRSLNVFPNRYDLQELVYLSQDGHEQHRKSQLRKGDLLVVRTGRPGDAAVVNGEVDGFNCIDLIIARAGHSIRPHYLMHFLNSAAGRTELTRLTAGTAQKHLNVTALNNVKIPVPTLNAQDFIIEKFSEIDDRIDKVYLHYQKGVLLKRSLLNQLL